MTRLCKTARAIVPALFLLTLAFASTVRADIMGQVYEGIPNPGNAADPANQSASLANAQFTSTGINYCSSFSDLSCVSAAYNVSAFLNSPTFTSPVNGFNPTATVDNTEVVLNGSIFLTAGANNFQINHDDGLTLSLDGGIGLVVNAPGPTPPVITPFTINAPSTGLYNFTLDYSECCGPPAVLQWTFPTGVPVGTVPEPSTFVMVGTGLLGLGGSLKRKFFSRTR
jgi:PEP-CTERM motif